jgi:PAS domain S-box-containing protein
MLKSLRYRLLAWFLAIVLLTVALIIPSTFIYHSFENRIGYVTQQIGSLHVDFLNDSRAVNDFLLVEPANSDFFVKGDNPNLNYHLRKSADILLSLEKIRNSRQIKAFGIVPDLGTLKDNLGQYNFLLDSLVYLVYKRGYQNFGLEGELYDYGSLLETSSCLDKQDVYQLRKIENEYFFNSDNASVDKLLQMTLELKKKLAGNGRLLQSSRAKASELIDNYERAFIRLVELDQQSGIRKNIALKAQLNLQSMHIEHVFARLTAKSITMQKALMQRLTLFYILSLFLIFILSIVFSYAAARHTVSHLEALTNYISVLSSNQQDHSKPIDLQNSAREIKQIYREFRNLLSQLKIWEKQRDKALQSAEYTQQRYQELADMLPQSVFETDMMGNYTYVNKAWYKAFGYSPRDLEEGLNLIETLNPESEREKILGQDRIENSNFQAICKDGKRFPVSVYTDNIVKDGKIDGRRGIIVDITDKVNYIKSLQQETSKAKISDELKSSFLANMSHEIRTPMNSIIGFSNLLASEHIPDLQKKDFVNYIRTSSEILLNLVDDIIDIAKIEAGELKIIKKECEIYGLGRELLTMSEESKKKFNKQQLELTFHPDPDHQELLLKTDAFRLRQILINLINNAIKFTEKGSVEFGFSVRDERFIEFYVKDTGVGLSRNELDVIFERFKRARRSEEKNIVGTGLGLAISKNLVQLLGGEMWVDSTPGAGTMFLFTVPYLRITRLPAEEEPVITEETKYNWTDAGILIVEDDPASISFIKEVFKNTGVRLLHACNGIEAVSLFRQNECIDLVIMDIQLPEMDGYEATRLIKSINGNIPVIAQTAFAMSGDREKMTLAGFDDYLAKPVNIPRLLAMVHHWLTTARSAVKPKLTSVMNTPSHSNMGYLKN